jgi:ribulose-phosphate 3-epimerase
MAIQRGNPWRQLRPDVLVAPSLLAADFVRLGEQITQAVAAGADVLHVDVMDGHFVPNLSMGPGVVKSVRRFTGHPLDVHLMVSDPGYFLEKFAQAGADSITFHVEAADQPHRLIDRLHELGLGAGVTLKPGTAADTLAGVIDRVDLVLVMTVEPGYGGQVFMDDMLPKIQQVRAMLQPWQRLEVDGGISPATAPGCARCGADVYVAGENIFGAADIPAAVRELREAALAGR